MKRVLLDGKFFAEWEGALEELAGFTGLELKRFTLEMVSINEAKKQLIDRLTRAVQDYMDSVAQQRNYDSILSLCTYATSTNSKFKAEGQAGVEWRDACWQIAHNLIETLQNEEGSNLSEDKIVGMLPTIVWPS